MANYNGLTAETLFAEFVANDYLDDFVYRLELVREYAINNNTITEVPVAYALRLLGALTRIRKMAGMRINRAHHSAEYGAEDTVALAATLVKEFFNNPYHAEYKDAVTAVAGPVGSGRNHKEIKLSHVAHELRSIFNPEVIDLTHLN